MKARFLLLLLLVIVQFLVGCADKYPRLEVVASLPDRPHCRVAVLPFTYQGEYPRGENIVFKAFTAELSAVAGFDVIAEGDVLLMYKQLKIYPKDIPNEEQLRILGQRLDAEVLVVGDILRITEIEGSTEVNTELTMVLNMVDGASGKLLWSTYHKRRGQEYRNVLHYGRVNSLSGLGRRMAEEIIALWIEKGMKQCVTP